MASSFSSPANSGSAPFAWSPVTSSLEEVPAATLWPVAELGEFSAPGVVTFLGWDPASRSILLALDGGPVAECRTARSPRFAVTLLVSALRVARDSGRPVRLKARGSWSTRRFFCAVVDAFPEVE